MNLYSYYCKTFNKCKTILQLNSQNSKICKQTLPFGKKTQVNLMGIKKVNKNDNKFDLWRNVK